jgi:hypothetical protein
MEHNNLIKLATAVENIEPLIYLGSIDTITEHVMRSLPHLSPKSKEDEFSKYRELQLSMKHIYEIRDFMNTIEEIKEGTHK